MRAARRVRPRAEDRLDGVRAGIDKRAMSALAAGHLGTDFANGAVPALLPFLVDRFSLSYTLAATLMLASAASSSLIQPLFGLWSDRRGALWLLPGGVAVAGIGIALAADAPSYWLVVVFVVISGIGVAAYHPEGSKFAAYASGRKRASGMSAFSIGGNLGFALGPIVATPLVLWFGLRGGLLLALPCLAIAGLLLVVTPFLRTFVPERNARRAVAGEDRVGALTLLLAVIAFRSLAWWGLLTFVPLWEVSLGHSKSYGNHLLSLMLLVGGIGTIVVGPAADRFGRRLVLLASLVAAGPLIFVFVTVGGIVGAAALALVGICVVGTFGLTMVMSQEYLPQHIGMASGLSIGLSIGLGGVAAVALGALADSVDLRTALYVCAAAPVAALVLTLLLPSTRARGRLEPEVAVP
jgi:MFS transporter, FSR family, fosmidomycin resistance protein